MIIQVGSDTNAICACAGTVRAFAWCVYAGIGLGLCKSSGGTGVHVAGLVKTRGWQGKGGLRVECYSKWQLSIDPCTKCHFMGGFMGSRASDRGLTPTPNPAMPLFSCAPWGAGFSTGGSHQPPPWLCPCDGMRWNTHWCHFQLKIVNS